jgi:hypothetical protein
MATKKALENKNRPQPAPSEFAGQWIAWNAERTEVVAHGIDFKNVFDAARHAGYSDPVMESVRPNDVYFIGAL